MKSFPLLIGAATILIILAGIFLFSKKPVVDSMAPSLPSSYEFYWGEGCPHCGNVTDFFNSWEKIDMVEIEYKEVYENQETAKLMLTRAQFCNLQNNQIGVPFLFTPEGECFIGDTPIINFFKQLEFSE